MKKCHKKGRCLTCRIFWDTHLVPALTNHNKPMTSARGRSLLQRMGTERSWEFECWDSPQAIAICCFNREIIERKGVCQEKNHRSKSSIFQRSNWKSHFGVSFAGEIIKLVLGEFPASHVWWHQKVSLQNAGRQTINPNHRLTIAATQNKFGDMYENSLALASKSLDLRKETTTKN